MLKKFLLLAVGFGIAMGIAACHEESKDKNASATSATTSTNADQSKDATTKSDTTTPSN